MQCTPNVAASCPGGYFCWFSNAKEMMSGYYCCLKNDGSIPIQENRQEEEDDGGESLENEFETKIAA